MNGMATVASVFGIGGKWLWLSSSAHLKAFAAINYLRSGPCLYGWGVWSILALFNGRYVEFALIECAMWRHPNVYPLLLVGLYTPFALASGWLVAYLHTQSGRAMVLLYAGSWWSFHTVLLAQIAVTRFSQHPLDPRRS
jgi:hypothetical protein